MRRKVGLEFLVNVVIPPGFILGDYNNFKVSISLDESDLVTNTIIDNYTCDEDEICTAIKNMAILTGMLNYNVVIGNFKPAEPIDSVVSSITTQFSSSGFLQISKVLQCSFNDVPVSTDYWISCKRGEEFIICADGESIRRDSNKQSFMRILNNPDQIRTISVPYKIRIFSGSPKRND